MIEEKTKKMLLALTEAEKMTYQQIVNLGFNRNYARKRLNELIEQSFIHEEGRKTWKPGKKLFYSITSKGRKEVLNLTLNNINEGLTVIQKIGYSFLDKGKEWRKVTRKAYFDVKITENMTLEERIKAFDDVYVKTDKRLVEAYKIMHKLFCQFLLPSQIGDFSAAIGFSERGDLYFIPIKLFEELKSKVKH